MTDQQMLLLRAKEIDDAELAQAMHDAVATGDTEDFFGRFEYYFPQQPFPTLLRGEAMLGRCSTAAPDAYKKLHKGTPFYWLAWAAFSVHDYETATFYIDAAVAEDLKAADDARKDRQSVSTPALLFFQIDDSDDRQALLHQVKMLRVGVETAIAAYNRRPDAKPPDLTMSDLQTAFIKRSLSAGNEHLRTLATTLISFILEWRHRSSIVKLRTEPGTVEPFFVHLFKGCVLFESLLKSNPVSPPHKKMLGGILDELRTLLGLTGAIQTANFDF